METMYFNISNCGKSLLIILQYTQVLQFALSSVYGILCEIVDIWGRGAYFSLNSLQRVDRSLRSNLEK